MELEERAEPLLVDGQRFFGGLEIADVVRLDEYSRHLAVLIARGKDVTLDRSRASVFAPRFAFEVVASAGQGAPYYDLDLLVAGGNQVAVALSGQLFEPVAAHCQGRIVGRQHASAQVVEHDAVGRLCKE